MSQIINKAFDASKKIIRSIFKGSPNLFTTADLNRQIEAIKYQLDLLDDKTGFVSDMNLSSATLSSSGNLSVTPTFTALKYKGCDFKPASKLLQINISSKPAYLALFAKTSEVTYETDSSHEIAGAKFADGTSQPAANQLVYTAEKLALIYADYTPNVAVDGVLLGVIAMFQQSSQGTLVVKKNYFTGVTDALSFRTESNVVNSDTSSTGQITPGMSYDQAINILQNRLNKLKNSKQSTWATFSGVSSPFKAYYKLTDGVLHIKWSQTNIKHVTSKNGAKVLTLAEFPSDISKYMADYVKNLGLYDSDLNNSGYIVLGNLGTSWMTASSGGSLGKADIGILVQICLIFYGTDNLILAAVPICIMDGSFTDISYVVFNGQPMYGWAGEFTLHTNATYAAIPFPGLNW